MTEEEARERVRTLTTDPGFARLENLVALVIAENQRQNLIARSTVPAIWSRHVLDSVQLLRWSDPDRGAWLDIGTGGGFPGLAIAAAQDGETILVEPRKLRATFLYEAASALGLTRTSVVARKVEAVHAAAATISARAVASVEKLLQAAGHCATPATRWLILKGRSAAVESATERQMELMFHVEQSLSDPASIVLVAERNLS